MKKPSLYTAIAATLLVLTGCSSNAKKMKINTLPYPVAAKSEVVDNYHGTLVADPYRWLEDDNSAETAAWVAAENEVTFNYLEQIPYREKIGSRLTELWNYEKIGMPSKVGERYFFFKNDGLQNQSVLYMMEGLDDSDPKVFLDPNTLSKEGTSALTAVTFSKDGNYMAYAVSTGGSDWVEIFVKEVPSGRLTSDHIKWVKFSGAEWSVDSKGFYYSAYDAPSKGSELSGKNEFQKVYYHALGTPQSKDKLVYNDPKHPLRYFHGSDDGDTGKWALVTSSEGTSGSEIMYKRTNSTAPFKVLLKGFKYDYDPVKVIGNTAYIYTNDNAPNFRLAKIDLENTSNGLVDVISESSEDLLQGVSFVGGYIIAQYLQDAMSKVVQYNINGEVIREIALPTIGATSGFSGEKDDEFTFYALSNFIAPPTIYSYDLETGESTIFAQPELSYDPDMFVSEQVFFTSKDGTEVPMFLTYRKDLKLNGKNTAYLYGYGGFNISVTPSFSPTQIAHMEQGGIYAVVSLRGGSEYGEKWHEGGMLENKQNVFDDFISAAEYLIDNKYTSSGKLAIAGASNGGLLVGACMTQRPDLFAVAFPGVGVLDMLRYHMFTIGWGWVVEYGSSEVAEQFEYIYKYSPLHNIKDGVCYPATMVTTADHDDRVVPAHSFKFAARLQEAQGCDNPALIRIDTNAGHGAGKSTTKRIEEATDVLSFMFWNTNTKYK